VKANQWASSRINTPKRGGTNEEREKEKKKRGTGNITVSIYRLWMCRARNLGSVPHRRQSLAILVLTTNKLVGLISGSSRFIFFFFFFRGGTYLLYIKKTASVQSIYSAIQSQNRVGTLRKFTQLSSSSPLPTTLNYSISNFGKKVARRADCDSD
jgi:hypothetical protein